MKKNNNKFSLLLAVALTCAVASHGQTIMTLKECVQTARKNNIMVKNNHNDLQMAYEQQEYARSKYYPTVGASVFHFEALDELIKYSLLNKEDVEMLSPRVSDGPVPEEPKTDAQSSFQQVDTEELPF